MVSNRLLGRVMCITLSQMTTIVGYPMPSQPRHHHPVFKHHGRTRIGSSMVGINSDAVHEPVADHLRSFDESHYNAFEEAVCSIVSRRNVMRDFKKKAEDLAVVKQHLLTRKRVLPIGTDQFASNLTSMDKGSIKQWLADRCVMYVKETGLTMQQHKLATILLAHLADHCARNSSPEPLYVAWDKVIESGMLPLSRTLSTYLYVLGHGDYSCSGRDIAEEVAMLHDCLYEPNEKTTTLLVKSLVLKGDASGAEALLDRVGDGPLGMLRHRTTSPILKLYCEQRDIDSALRLYHRMRTTSRVKMDECTYCNFISAVAQERYFAVDGNRLLGASDLGYPESGPDFLNALLSDMAEDVLEISSESAEVLQIGFAYGFHASGDVEGLSCSRVTIDENTAKCPMTDAILRLITLEPAQRNHVRDTLIKMAREKSLEYTAKLTAQGRGPRDEDEKAEEATRMLAKFSERLDTREGKPFTAIVDGANVAYFGFGKVNLHQLMHAVNALQDQGEHPLVVFPLKYTRKSFHLRYGVVQVLGEEELGLLQDLKERGLLYVVPPMCLDDLYWMLASVSDQTTSRKGVSIDVPKHDNSGRFPGLRPMVITNDRMRDHKLELLDERAFRRWCCSHIVNYNFTQFIENERDEREISFHAADIFSDEIQANVCPDGGVAWHFPVSDWEKNERFCLKLPT